MLPACCSLGHRYGAVLSVPLATVKETKVRLQPAEPVGIEIGKLLLVCVIQILKSFSQWCLLWFDIVHKMFAFCLVCVFYNLVPC